MSSNKRVVDKFEKKKQPSGVSNTNNKILKKSHSDKNMIKSRPPKNPGKMVSGDMDDNMMMRSKE